MHPSQNKRKGGDWDDDDRRYDDRRYRDRDYRGDTSWRSDGFNDWWHDEQTWQGDPLGSAFDWIAEEREA